MIRAFNIAETWEYTLRSDTEDPKTVFILGHLDTALRNHLNDGLAAFTVNEKGDDAPADVQVKVNELRTQTVRFGVRGWRNFKDHAGNDVPFDTVSVAMRGVGNRHGLAMRSVDMLQPYITELAEAIMAGNTLTDDEKKS